MNQQSELQALALQADANESQVYAEMLACAPASFRARCERVGSGLALITPGIPIPLFNRVLGLGLQEPVDPEQLAAIESLYAEAGVSRYYIQPLAFARPENLPQLLAARGWQSGFDWIKVWRGPEPPPAIATDLRVRPVNDAQAEIFGQVAAAGFKMPAAMVPWLADVARLRGWQAYLAWDGDRAVAAAALRVQQTTAWLGIGATLPEARRRGGQGALMVRRIQDAIAVGCETIFTETGVLPDQPNPSLANMFRTGFRELYLRPNYEKK
ncbi:MAG: hypothetical protein ACAI44_25735 [Candidatus Sericytochromatia bacterium]